MATGETLLTLYSIGFMITVGLVGFAFYTGDLMVSFKRFIAKQSEGWYNAEVIGYDNRRRLRLVKSEGGMLLIDKVPYSINKSKLFYVKGAPTLVYAIGNPEPIDPHYRGYIQEDPEQISSLLIEMESIGRAAAQKIDQKRWDVIYYASILSIILLVIILISGGSGIGALIGGG